MLSLRSLAEDSVNTGNLRETFFMNQMKVRNDIVSSDISDFRIGGKKFEIGGKSKGRKQIETAREGGVGKEGGEYSAGNILPLWGVGLYYL